MRERSPDGEYAQTLVKLETQTVPVASGVVQGRCSTGRTLLEQLF